MSGKEELETGFARFNEFLQFIADEGRIRKVNVHWRNIHDLCHPCFVKYDYIAKLETIEQDFQFIGKRINKKATNFPDKSLGPVPPNYREENYTEVFIKYYSTVNKDTLNRLRKLYELDFKLFGYDEHAL